MLTCVAADAHTDLKTDPIMLSSAPEAAARFLTFVNASPTPFHAVCNAALLLEKAGFRKVTTSPSLM